MQVELSRKQIGQETSKEIRAEHGDSEVNGTQMITGAMRMEIKTQAKGGMA